MASSGPKKSIPTPTLTLSMDSSDLMETLFVPPTVHTRVRRHSAFEIDTANNETTNSSNRMSRQASTGASFLHPLSSAFSQFSFIKKDVAELAKIGTREEPSGSNLRPAKGERGSQDDLALLKVPDQRFNNIFSRGGLNRVSISTEIINKLSTQPAFNFTPAWLNQTASPDKQTPFFK